MCNIACSGDTTEEKLIVTALLVLLIFLQIPESVHP